jgi:hypothetical protein
MLVHTKFLEHLSVMPKGKGVNQIDQANTFYELDLKVICPVHCPC